MIDHNVRVDAADTAGATPLHLASACGHEKIVELLNSSGARINVRDRRGCTPLHWACTKDHAPVVEKLLKYGAMVDLYDDEGWTPLHRYVPVPPPCLPPSWEPMRRVSPLCSAAFNGRTDIVKMLVQKGGNPANCTPQGNTCLHLAASQNMVSTVEVGRCGARMHQAAGASRPLPFHPRTCLPPPQYLCDEVGMNTQILNGDGNAPHMMTAQDGIIEIISRAAERNRVSPHLPRSDRGSPLRGRARGTLPAVRPQRAVSTLVPDLNMVPRCRRWQAKTKKEVRSLFKQETGKAPDIDAAAAKPALVPQPSATTTAFKGIVAHQKRLEGEQDFPMMDFTAADKPSTIAEQEAAASAREPEDQ